MTEFSQVPIIVCGPTASGKTALAERIAEHLSSPVINGDQSQALKFYSVGTGRIFNSRDIEYRLTNIFHPNDRNTTYEMVWRMRKEMKKLLKEGKTPVICGGSHHLIERFIKGMEPTPSPDIEQRNSWKQNEIEFGNGHLHSRLKELRPDLASKVHPNNIHRIVRYLEIATDEKRIPGISPLFNDPIIIFVKRPVKEIETNIASRTERMFANGWLEEVRDLCELGFRQHIIDEGPLGYSYVLDELENEIARPHTIDKICRDTLLLARKQIRWEKRLDINIVQDGKDVEVDDILGLIGSQHDE